MKSPSRDIFGADFNGTPSHQRVLKPPGGGSSDIFGTGGAPSQQETPVRRVKNHQASNLFLNDGPAQATPSRSHGKDTYSRLFGPPPVTPSSTKDKMTRSNILLSDEDKVNDNVDKTGQQEQLDNGDTNPTTDSTDGHVNGENGHAEETMNGQQPMMNGNSASINGNPTPQPNNSAPRGRVPPGGFSSGLW